MCVLRCACCCHHGRCCCCCCYQLSPSNGSSAHHNRRHKNRCISPPQSCDKTIKQSTKVKPASKASRQQCHLVRTTMRCTPISLIRCLIGLIALNLYSHLLTAEATSQISSVWLAANSSDDTHSQPQDHKTGKNVVPKTNRVHYWQPAPAPTFASLTPTGGDVLSMRYAAAAAAANKHLSAAASSLQPAIVDSDTNFRQQSPQRRSETVTQYQPQFKIAHIDNNESSSSSQSIEDFVDLLRGKNDNSNQTQLVQFDEEQHPQQQANGGSGGSSSATNNSSSEPVADYEINRYDGTPAVYLTNSTSGDIERRRRHNSTQDFSRGQSDNLVGSSPFGNFPDQNQYVAASSASSSSSATSSSSSSSSNGAGGNSVDPMDDATYYSAANDLRPNNQNQNENHNGNSKSKSDTKSNGNNINNDNYNRQPHEQTHLRPTLVDSSSWLPSASRPNQSSLLYYLSEPSATTSTPASVQLPTTALDIQRIKFSSNDQWRRPQVHLFQSDIERQMSPTTTLATTVSDTTQPTTFDSFTPTTLPTTFNRSSNANLWPVQMPGASQPSLHSGAQINVHRPTLGAPHQWNPNVLHPNAYNSLRRHVGEPKSPQLSQPRRRVVVYRQRPPPPPQQQPPGALAYSSQEQMAKLNSQRRGFRPSNFVERVRSVPIQSMGRPVLPLTSNNNNNQRNKLSLFSSLGNRLNGWNLYGPGGSHTSAADESARVQATLESAFFDGLPVEVARPQQQVRRRRPSRPHLDSGAQPARNAWMQQQVRQASGSVHRPTFVSQFAYATPPTGNFYDHRNGATTAAGSIRMAQVAPQMAFYAPPAGSVAHPQVSQAAQNSLDRLYGVGYLPTPTQHQPAWLQTQLMAPIGAPNSLLLQPAVGRPRRRRPLNSPSAATMAVVVDGSSQPAPMGSYMSASSSQQAIAAPATPGRNGFIPVVALQVTRTSPAPTNLLRQSQQDQQDSTNSNANEHERARSELDAYLEAKTNGHGNAQQQEYNSLASSISMVGPQASGSAPNGASPSLSTRSNEHMTTIKSALFGYLPQQLAADAPNIQQALNVLSQLSQNGPPTLATGSVGQNSMPLASDYTHHLAHLPATDSSSPAPSGSSSAGEPPGLALQLQANNYAQNDIVHPFGLQQHSNHMATPVAGDASLGSTGGGGGHGGNSASGSGDNNHARQVFFYPQEALRFVGYKQPHHWPLGGIGNNQPSAAAAAAAGEHMLAAAGSELNPFLPAAMMFNPAIFNAEAQNTADATEDTSAASSVATTTTAASTSGESDDNDEHDDDTNDQQPTNTLQSLLSGATGASTATKSGNQISNKKRSSDFFASAGQLLLSALPLLLVPSLGFMFSSSAASASGSTGASGAARYHAPNPLQPSEVPSGGSSGYQPTGYLSDGYVMNASPAPQLFTPIPPASGSYSNYAAQESSLSRNRNVTSGPNAMAQNGSHPVAGATSASSTTTSTTIRPRPTPTVNPVMRLAASSIVGSISPSLGASHSPLSSGHNSIKHLYKSPTSQPSFSGVRTNGSNLHTLVDEPSDYSDPLNPSSNAAPILRKPISTVIITTAHPNYNQSSPVVLSDDYLNATNNSITIRQPTILLVTQDDSDELQRRGDTHNQQNRRANGTMSTANWSNSYGLLASESGSVAASNRYDTSSAENKTSGASPNKLEHSYDGLDFDAQYASLPTIRNNHGSSSSSSATRFNAHRPPAHLHPSISYLTTPAPALKHIRDKNRYQYVDVSDEYGAPSELNSSLSTSDHRSSANVDIYTLHAHKPVQVVGTNETQEERLYPMSTWPAMRRRTVSLVTANGNKTVLDSSAKYNNNGATNSSGISNNASSSIVDDLTRELAADGLHLWRPKHRSKRATSASQVEPASTTTMTPRPLSRRRNLIRKVVRVRPHPKLGTQLDVAETGKSAAIVEKLPALQRNRIKGPILSDRMDAIESDVEGDSAVGENQRRNVDALRQDDSRSKSSHLITAMIEHLDNESENLDDRQLINAARRGNVSDDWDLREQTLRKKMMLDKIATKSFASSSDKNSHRTTLLRNPTEPLEMGFGGRGRFPVDTSAAATGTRQVSNLSRSNNHRYSNAGDAEDKVQRMNSLELNDETKRALAKFGKLLLEDTLKVEPNLRAANSNVTEATGKQRHKLPASVHRLVKADQDAYLGETDYSPTRPSASEGAPAATERYYSHSVTRAPEPMHHASDHTWLDSPGSHNATSDIADDYRSDPPPPPPPMHTRRRSLQANLSAGDQWKWRASDEAPPAAYQTAVDRGGYGYSPQPQSESPVNRYNNFLASTQAHSNGSSASSMPSRTLTSAYQELDQDRPRYNSTRYAAEWGSQVTDSPRYEFSSYAGPQRGAEPQQQQQPHQPPTEAHYRPMPPQSHYRVAAAHQSPPPPPPPPPAQLSDHFRAPVYSHSHEMHQFTPNDTRYYTHRPYPPTADIEYHYHTPATSQQPSPAHRTHQQPQAFIGGAGDDQYRAERARPTYQPHYIEPLPVREPLPPPPPASQFLGGQYAASVPVRRPIMRPGAPSAQAADGELMNPYAQSGGFGAAAPLFSSPFASSQRQDDGAVKDYLKRAQFSDSDRDKLMASYLTCDGLLNDNDHCLERLACEFSDPKNIEKANKLDRAVSSILLGHILINTYIPNQFKLRLKSASMFGYTQSGKCSRYLCNKLIEQQQQQQQQQQGNNNNNNNSGNENNNSANGGSSSSSNNFNEET